MPSVDANILLRLALDDVEHRRQAVIAILKQYEQVAVSELAITETVYVLEKSLNLSRRQVAKYVNSLLANQHINCNRQLFEKVLPLYERHPARSFNDICLAVEAEQNSATPLYTFDKKLANQLESVQLLQ